LTNSELAMSSYSTLVRGDSIDQEEDFEQDGDGLSPLQAQQFAEKFPTIIGQYKDSSSGFNVTAFRSVGGDLSLAFRGTESTSANDLGADLQLFSRGAAIDQIISMYNWWMRISTVPGENVVVPQYQRSYYTAGVEEPPSGSTLLYNEPLGTQGLIRSHYLILLDGASPISVQEGNIGEELHSTTPAKVDVTGHSLGGHLALAFHALFGSFVNEGFAFNAPGIADNSTTQNLFAGLGGTVSTTASPNFTQVIATETSDGSPPFTATAGLHFTSSQLSSVLHIAIEDQNPGESGFPNFDGNHSIQTLTDAFAVFALLTELDSTLSSDEFYNIFQASSNETYDTLEHIVMSVASLFGVPDPSLPAGSNHRNDLYEKMAAIRANGHFFSLKDLTPFYLHSKRCFLATVETCAFPGMDR